MPHKIKPMPEMNADLVRMFWARVRVGGADECWPLVNEQGEPNTGYGYFRGVLASRLALFLSSGVDKIDKYACHTCDNPPCCNPAHLYHGTPQQNMQDAVVRNRKVGRPPKNPDEVRDVVLSIRLTRKEHMRLRSLFVSQAPGDWQTWLRTRLLEAAKR